MKSGKRNLFRRSLVLATASLSVLLRTASLPAQTQAPGDKLKKIILAVPSLSSSNMPPVVAKELGHYRKAGFDVEIVLMRAGVSIQALVAGSVDYTGTPGATVAAAVQGVKMYVLMGYADKPLYDLIVRPEISTYADLRGKILGVGSLSGFSFEISQVMLARNGLNPKQDVKMILIGPTESRLAALRANAIQATIVEPPYNFLALKDGFRKLGYSGDYYRTLQGALTVSEQKINADPDEVARFVKATLRGLHAYRDQKDIALSVMRKFLNIKDADLAQQIYNYHRQTLTPDGTVSDELMRSMIESYRQSGKVSRPVGVAEVFRFDFVRAAQKELE